MVNETGFGPGYSSNQGLGVARLERFVTKTLVMTTLQKMPDLWLTIFVDFRTKHP